jgi:parallel beta-helix repeat protein
MNDRTRLLLLVPCLALLALVTVLVMTFVGSSGASAACTMPNPPANGDWIIYTGEICTPTAGPWTVNGNIEVQNNGNLTLNGVQVRMASASQGQRTINVRTGGTFNIFGGSTITASVTSFHYKFLIEMSATVQISSSTVEYCGYDISPDDAIGMRVQSNQVTITKSTFRNGYAGIYVKGASPTIDNSTFSSNRFGIFIAGNAAKPTFYDNKVLTNGDGVFVTDAAPTLKNNEIHDNVDRGVFLLRADATLTTNNIHNNRYAVYIQSASPTLTGNIIQYHLDGIRGYFASPIIKGNNFHHMADYTIYMYECGGTIEGNSLNGPLWTETDSKQLNAIYLVTSTTTVKGNKIYNYNNSAVYIGSGSNVKILNNDIEYFENYAIRVASSTVDIEGNTFQNPQENYTRHVSISGSSGIIKGNQFLYGRYGLDVSFADESLVVEGNTFKHFVAPTIYRAGSAIVLYEAHIIVKGNTFDDNTRGINVTNSKPKIIGNKFSNNYDGIDVNFYTDAYIADNTFVLGNKSMNIWGGRATVVNNTISFSANYSLFAQFGSYVRMIGNRIDGNGQYGVWIQNSVAWLSNNTFSNSGTGLSAFKAVMTLDHNNFTKDEDGLYFGDSTVTMDGDIFSNNTVDGLTTLDSNVILNGLRFYDNKEAYYSSNCSLYLTDARFVNNKIGLRLRGEASASVHGLYITGSQELAVEVTGNKATRYIKNYIDGLTFERNQAPFKIQFATVVLTSSTFDGGQAGVEVNNGTLNVKDCTFGSINATAITTVDGTITVDGSYLFNNTMGIYSQTSVLTVLSSRIEDSNETGIQVDRTKLVVRDSRIVNNKDGIFELGGSSFDILDCNISSNKVFGIYTTESSTHVMINYTRKLINEDNIFMIHGQLVVSDGGQLYLLRSNLEFWSDAPGGSGLIVMTGGQLIMRENVVSAYFHDKGYYFTAEPGSYLEISNATFRHCGRGMTGNIRGLEVRTDKAYLTDIYFEDNQVGLHVVTANIEAYRLRFNANTDGMWLEDSEVYLVSGSFNASSDKDIILIRSTARLLDSTVTFAKCDIHDPASLLVVMWYLKVTVVWNDGQPVNGATVNVTDKGHSVQVGHTDAQGDSPRFIVREYQQKGPDPSGYAMLTPTDITVSVNHLTVGKSVYVGTSMSVRITMNDDKPPVIKVTTPLPGEVMYTGSVLFTGTAYDEGSSVAMVEISLDGKNWFTANGTTSWSGLMTLPEGPQVAVKIRGTDTRGNSNITIYLVEVDLTNPLLQIYHPLDGYVTNLTKVTVSGKVHQGAQLVINNQPVKVDFNGTFTYILGLTEGQNKVHAKAISKDGNSTLERDLIVIRDTTPPEIKLLHPTPGEFVNRSTITVTVSSNEEVSFFLNGQPVSTFGGKADGAVKLQEGKNIITVKAVDLAGNWNLFQFNVTLDTAKPDLVLIKPPAVVFSTTSDKLTILGRTEVGANLTLNKKPLVMGADGNFTVKKGLKVGKNSFTITSTDKAGNANIRVLEVARKQVTDYTPYYILFVVVAILGIVGDIGTVIYFKKYYVPKGPTTKSGGGLSEEESEEKELMDGLEGEEGWEKPKDGQRRYPKRPPPPAEEAEETEFETVEDLGEF